MPKQVGQMKVKTMAGEPAMPAPAQEVKKKTAKKKAGRIIDAGTVNITSGSKMAEESDDA